MTRIESIIALLKANTGASTVAPTTVATYANLAETITLETISSGIMATSPLKGAFDGLPTADLLDQMFISLFGYTQAEMDALKATEAGAAGYQYWINELANNSDMINVNTLAIALLNGAAAADATKAAALVADDVDAYEIYAGTGETPVETEGQTVYLTSNQDILVGTDGNDTFVARGNNTLTNADIIDGGKGTDTVYVMLDKGETAESPLLTNIEILKVQAQATTEDSGDNDVDASNLPNNDIESNIDAGDMKSVEVYINDNSRADLTIEDVSRNSHITTLVMRETDMGDVDYNVFFDPENITAPGSADAGATLLIKLANVLNIAENANPVDNFASLSFTVGATTVTADISAATSYDDVVTAIEAAIAAKGLVGLTVQKQADAPAYFSIDVATYTAGQLAGSYNPILITNNASGTLTPGTIQLSDSATNSNMTNTMTNVEGSSVPSLTQTNVVFDRVGRDSKGGDFIAGSDSTGNSGSKGIEQFNVSVDRDSWLTSVSSTNNTLEVINIKNIKENSDGNGSLRIDSVEDVRVIDASAMTGSANISASLTDGVVAKYLDLKDTQSNPAADNSDDNFLNVVDTYFSYDFGSNNDTFNLTISQDLLAKSGTIENEDFVMEINTNDGDDVVTIDGPDTIAENTFWYANSKINSQETINTGAGNDTVTTAGSIDFIVNTGTGNDTVYTENTGTKAQWVTSATSVTGNGDNDTDTLAVESAALASTFLYKGKLTVSFSGAIGVNAADATTTGTSGYEVTVDIPTGSNYEVTTLHLNQAIKNAINNDPVLSKLLVAEDTDATSLVITSLVDGAYTIDDLVFSVSHTDYTTLSATEQTTIEAAYDRYSKVSTSSINDAETAADNAETTLTDLLSDTTGKILTETGANSTVTSDTTVDLGNGNDVVVLSTTATSEDTIVFTGTIGDNTVVNFVTGNVAGSDDLDFTSYLTTKVSASGSTASEQFVAVTLNADADVEANSVTILGAFAEAGAETWAGLTAQNLLDSIKADGNTGNDYGNLADATLDSLVVTDLVGTTYKSIVMIENDKNDGEYKVFELTANGTDFTAATLLGTVDFGDELTGFVVGDLAQHA